MIESLVKSVRYATFEGSPWPALLALSFSGVVTGLLLARWISRMAQESRTQRRNQILLAVTTPLLFSLLFLAVARWRCQEIVEGGSLDWYPIRILVQLVLVALMLAATGIDFKRYEIPDSITIPGMLCGLASATLTGNIQMLPLWIDWNHPLTQTFGPYIPEWIKQHNHLHGFAWSLAGLLAGGGITWLARLLSQIASGQESLGFGDVTLMAMIGSFLGWQPILFAFIFAPLWGLLGALIASVISSRSYIPYGPYLCAGAFTVMLSWRWLWPPVRLIFGHWPTLALLVGGIFFGLVLLLALLRAYKSMPVR